MVRKKKNNHYSQHYAPIKNKNSYIGRTYKVSDNDLPHKNANSNKVVNVAVIDENTKGELAVTRLTTRESKNAKPFKYKHRIYKGYKTFIDIKFQNNDSISARDIRLKENPWENNLTETHLQEIRNTNLYHSRQSKDNFKKIQYLKRKQKK